MIKSAFFITEDDEVQKISQSLNEKLFIGRAKIKEFAGKVIKYGVITYLFEGSKPTEEYEYVIFKEDGYVNSKATWRTMATAASVEFMNEEEKKKIAELKEINSWTPSKKIRDILIKQTKEHTSAKHAWY